MVKQEIKRSRINGCWIFVNWMQSDWFVWKQCIGIFGHVGKINGNGIATQKWEANGTDELHKMTEV